MMKSEQEAPIVFSNPLMQHIGREVVVNDGCGDFRGWVVDLLEEVMLVVDLGFEVNMYTHDGSGIWSRHATGTLRWFRPSNVRFVNEDGSLSDE